MRVEWEKQDLGAARLDHFADLGFGGWVAIAHAEIHHDVVAVALCHRRLDRSGLLFGNRQKWALIGLGIPDRLVIRAGFGGPRCQNDQLQKWLPN